MILRKVEGSWGSVLDRIRQEVESNLGPVPSESAGNLMIRYFGNFYLVDGRIEAILESCHWYRRSSDAYQQAKKKKFILMIVVWLCLCLVSGMVSEWPCLSFVYVL